VRLIEGIEEQGLVLGKVTRAKEFLHYRPILPFEEGIIAGLAGSGFGEVHQQLAPLPDA
jgi:hypothetical protein